MEINKLRGQVSKDSDQVGPKIIFSNFLIFLSNPISFASSDLASYSPKRLKSALSSQEVQLLSVPSL